MGSDPERACPNCGLLVLTPVDEACPYCDHERGAWVAPHSLQLALRDWQGSMRQLQSSREGSKIVLGLVAVPAALAINEVAPWTRSALLNVLMLIPLIGISFAIGRFVVSRLHRLPAPGRWLRSLPGLSELRGPEASRSIEEHGRRVGQDLRLLNARLQEIEDVRADMAERMSQSTPEVAGRYQRSIEGLDRALGRLEDMKMTIEVGAAILDRALWRLKLRAVRALAISGGAGVRQGLEELNSLLRDGQQAVATIKALMLDSTTAGQDLLQQWSALEEDVAQCVQELTDADERSMHERASRVLSRAAQPETSHLVLQAYTGNTVEAPSRLPELRGIEAALAAVEMQATELELQVSAAEELQQALTRR